MSSTCNNKGHCQKSITGNKPRHQKEKTEQHASDVDNEDDTSDFQDKEDTCGEYAVCISISVLKSLHNNKAFVDLNILYIMKVEHHAYQC